MPWAVCLPGDGQDFSQGNWQRWQLMEEGWGGV